MGEKRTERAEPDEIRVSIGLRSVRAFWTGGQFFRTDRGVHAQDTSID
jgi:hypothetical protein